MTTTELVTADLVVGESSWSPYHASLKDLDTSTIGQCLFGYLQTITEAAGNINPVLKYVTKMMGATVTQCPPAAATESAAAPTLTEGESEEVEDARG